MQSVRYILLGAAVLVVSACGDVKAGVSPSPTPSAQVAATEIIFVEQEKDIPPYQTRMVATKDYLRFDDGPGSRDFILYNRKQQVIYRVNSSDHTIMSIDDHGIAIKPPFDLNLSEKDLGPMKDAPKVAGHAPIHYQFSAKGELCYDVIAVPGLMPGALSALRAFRKVLATNSTYTFNLIPAGLHNACDMARNTFAPNRHLSHGFPIQEWRKDGYSRSLRSYNLHYRASPALFRLPRDYQRYNLQDFREGKVKLGG